MLLFTWECISNGHVGRHVGLAMLGCPTISVSQDQSQISREMRSTKTKTFDRILRSRSLSDDSKEKMHKISRDLHRDLRVNGASQPISDKHKGILFGNFDLSKENERASQRNIGSKDCSTPISLDITTAARRVWSRITKDESQESNVSFFLERCCFVYIYCKNKDKWKNI